jgi:hypothetical protein
LTAPSLTFFSELKSPELVKLFSSSSVIKNLKALNANIGLGLLDFTEERAGIVKKLTRAGIPVTAWLLLPKNEGYWTNLDTIGETARQYAKFKTWTRENKLNWAAVGLDIEPKLDYLVSLQKSLKSQLPTLCKRLLSSAKYAKLEFEMRVLVQRIRSDGFAVETYQLPTVLDERAAHSNVLTKTLGTPPVDSDREVVMLYSSFIPRYGASMLWSYAGECQAIGIGSTGGGVEIEGLAPLKSLRWIELKRDLLLANKVVHNIYIFSLEGCVEKGYLTRIQTLDWSDPVHLPVSDTRRVKFFRYLLKTALWKLSHPVAMIIFFLSLMGITRYFHNHRHQV